MRLLENGYSINENSLGAHLDCGLLVGMFAIGDFYVRPEAQWFGFPSHYLLCLCSADVPRGIMGSS